MKMCGKDLELSAMGWICPDCQVDEQVIRVQIHGASKMMESEAENA